MAHFAYGVVEDIQKDKARIAQARESERPRKLEVQQTCEIPDHDSGKIMCLKSDSLMNLHPPSRSNRLSFAKRNNPPPADDDHTDISLYNVKDELILHMSIRRQQGVIIFNTRASRAVHYGWGPEEVVQLESYRADISRSDRILVYDLGDRFQIIFGLTTIYYFVKRFSNGTPAKISYSTTPQYATEGNLLLSKVVFISVFNQSDLPLYEQEIIETHSKSCAGVGGGLSNALFQRRTSPLATLSWDDGKELRVYHLGPGNILQESVYSEREPSTNKWSSGDLHKFKIVLASKSSIAAIQWHDEIRLYYQDQASDFIHELRKPSRNAAWAQGTMKLKALKNSSIAAIMWIDDGIHIRVYYQDPKLYLKEYCQDRASSLATWTQNQGLFEHGPDPSRTPIFAEVLHERQGYVRISLSWKDAKSQPVNRTQEIPLQTILKRPLSMDDGSG